MMGTPTVLPTPAEAERLYMLIEEAAEVQQAASKILRHGYDNHHPFNPPRNTNRLDLLSELMDLSTIVRIMERTGDLNFSRYPDSSAEMIWRDKKLPWTRFQEGSK